MSNPGIARLVRNWYLGKASDFITSTNFISASDNVKVNTNINTLDKWGISSIVCDDDKGPVSYDGEVVFYQLT